MTKAPVESLRNGSSSQRKARSVFGARPMRTSGVVPSICSISKTMRSTTAWMSTSTSMPVRGPVASAGGERHFLGPAGCPYRWVLERVGAPAVAARALLPGVDRHRAVAVAPIGLAQCEHLRGVRQLCLVIVIDWRWVHIGFCPAGRQLPERVPRRLGRAHGVATCARAASRAAMRSRRLVLVLMDAAPVCCSQHDLGGLGQR